MFCFVCLCLFQHRHCFLVGWCTNKSYVMAASDLWLFIHASNLLPSLPYKAGTGLEVEESKVAWNVQAKGWIRIDCVCVAFCICWFVCKWLYTPTLYNQLGFSVSMTTSLLVDCYSVYATTSIFHFPEQCGDSSGYWFHHDRTLVAWPLIWYYLTHLAPDRPSSPALFPYRETPDRPVAAS